MVASVHQTESFRVYRGPLFHTLSKEEGQYFTEGALVVDAQGKIRDCLSWQDFQAQYAALPSQVFCLPESSLILPGLIDLHVHLPQMEATGRQESSLLTWLDRHIFPTEAMFADPAHAERVSRWFFEELLRHGTTTAAVFLTPHVEAARIAFRCAENQGNRVVMGLNLMDCNAPADLVYPTETMLEQAEQLYHEWHNQANGRIQYAWMPRFAITSTEKLLSGLGRLRKKYPEAYFHTHLSEQNDEIQAVMAQFPWAKNYTEVYDHFELLGPRTILAHGIHLSDEELDRLGATDSGLAHCPGSNFFLKSGRFRWFDVVRKNLRFGLGSDVGAGPELSLFKVMKDAQYMQPQEMIAVNALFYAATLGAARALMREESLGNFLPGKEADFIIVDWNAKQSLPALNDEISIQERLSMLIYLGDDRLVSHTYVQGNEVYRKGEPLRTYQIPAPLV